MPWRVEYSTGVEKQLRKMGRDAERRIRRHLETVIAALDDPRQVGGPLIGKLHGYWRYRIGDYRVLCDLRDDTLIILVVEVGHRREVYR